jgi:ribonuclease Y
MNGNPLVLVAIAMGAALLGGGLMFLIQRAREESRIRGGRDRVEELLQKAREEAESTKKAASLEAKEEWLRRKEEFDRETQATRKENQRSERRLADREQSLNRRSDSLDRREKDLQSTESKLHERAAELDQLRDQQRTHTERAMKELERVAGLTAEDAKRELTQRIHDDAQLDVARRIKELKETAVRDADKEARKILALAVNRLASEVSSEITVSVVTLPNDEMKGRIIGREGRNIRAFEQLTGIDVIIDDTPEAVVLSCFDPVRREVGRLALERLIADGRIHPTRIEEVIEKSQKEVDQVIRESGEKACLDLGITGVHDQVIRTLGRLRYRTSYGQQILHHSMDVAYICGMMASELGLDVAIARRSGLFHDIGKAVDHEVEGPHAEIGANILRKYGESKVVCEAVGAHHDNVDAMPSVYPVLVQAADAVSGARPGARRETLATYVKRLEKLEGIAREFQGVTQAYAIQAGREIRVMVDSEKTDDATATVLSMEVARKIELEMDYPGTIKVVVIREMRSVEYAK